MAKNNTASISVGDVLNNSGNNPSAETKGLRLTIKPTRFVASVKKDKTFKTISLAYQTIRIENESMAAAYGFPIGATIAINAYLPVKKANKEQIGRAVRNWQAAQEAKSKGDEGEGTLNVDDFTDASDDDDSND